MHAKLKNCNFFNVMHIFRANIVIIGTSYQSLVFAIKGLHILKKSTFNTNHKKSTITYLHIFYIIQSGW